MLHSRGGSSALLWSDAIAELARLGRAIAYDRRRCGRSERPEGYECTTVAEQADDAAALLEALADAPALIDAVLGENAWTSFPADVRQVLTRNGPALLAELHYVEEPQPDAAAFAGIDKPTLLVAASESPSEQREMTAAMPAAPEVLAFIEEVLERR